MTRRHVSRHQTREGETLGGIARQYRLSSARALADAPDNASVLDGHRSGASLPAGMLIAIPPNVTDLSKERIYLIDRIRPRVLAHFHSQDVLLERDVLRLNDGGDLSDPAVVGELLGNLQEDLERAIAELAALTMPLMQVNEALMTTHVHASVMGRGGAVRQADHFGLAWLCGIELYPAWLDMWSTDQWLAKWAGTSWPEATRAAGLYLNVIRSKVVQHVDTRLRESQALIQRAMIEGPN